MGCLPVQHDWHIHGRREHVLGRLVVQRVQNILELAIDREFWLRSFRLLLDRGAEQARLGIVLVRNGDVFFPFLLIGALFGDSEFSPNFGDYPKNELFLGERVFSPDQTGVDLFVDDAEEAVLDAVLGAELPHEFGDVTPLFAVVPNTFEEHQIFLLAPLPLFDGADGGDPLLLELPRAPEEVVVAVRAHVELLGNFVPAWTLVLVVDFPALAQHLQEDRTQQRLLLGFPGVVDGRVPGQRQPFEFAVVGGSPGQERRDPRPDIGIYAVQREFVAQVELADHEHQHPDLLPVPVFLLSVLKSPVPGSEKGITAPAACDRASGTR